jgi:hypothetical protein
LGRNWLEHWNWGWLWRWLWNRHGIRVPGGNRCVSAVIVIISVIVVVIAIIIVAVVRLASWFVTFCIEHEGGFAFTTSCISLGCDDQINRLIVAEVHLSCFESECILSHIKRCGIEPGFDIQFRLFAPLKGDLCDFQRITFSIFKVVKKDDLLVAILSIMDNNIVANHTFGVRTSNRYLF